MWGCVKIIFDTTPFFFLPLLQQITIRHNKTKIKFLFESKTKVLITIHKYINHLLYFLVHK